MKKILLALWLVGVLFFLFSSVSKAETLQIKESEDVFISISTEEAWMIVAQLKDCSRMTNCRQRCQCQYDNCTSGCGSTDISCVNKCISTWQDCNGGCR